MGRWRLALFAWLWWPLALWAQAGGPLVIGTQDRYDLGQHLAFLEDAGGTLRIEDMAQAAGRFRPVVAAGPGANFGLTRSAIWLRSELKAGPAIAPGWLLELAYPPLDRVELYAPDGRGGWLKQVGGDLEPYGTRAVPHRNHVMPVNIAPDTTATVYLRITSEGTVSAPLSLWRPHALWAHDQAAYAGLSLYFGLLAGLLLYNLLLFVSVRDRGYLIYVAFAAAMGMAQAALTGVAYQFIWPQAVWWNSVSPPVGMTMAAVFGLMFARHFLSSRQRMPQLDKVLLVLMAGWLASMAAALALPYRYSSLMVTVLAVVSVAVMFVIGYISIRREFAGARYFFAAWALLLIGVFTLFLHNTGVVPSNIFTTNALLIGSALEMVLLSFALADRINVARRFKEQAQARIAAEHAMVEALSQSQERLRTVLEEREIILESSIVGIAFLTPKGRFRWANKAMMEIFGAQAMPVHSIEPFYVSRDDYLEVGAAVARAVQKGEVYEKELQMKRVDGTLIWASLSGKAVNRADLSQGTVWVIMDITQRKELEERLQKTMSEREAILNNALVGIVLSVNRRHEWVNEKFAQMLGYPRQVLIGQASDYIHPDRESWERFGVEARQALIDSGTYACEMRIKRRNGELFWVQMGGSCVRPNDPDSGVIWTFLDITGRKKSESEIRGALEQQKSLNELRSRFVAMTSHEFRTPLAAILSAEELLRHYGDRLAQPERLEVLDSISTGVQRMSRMMDRVLLLGRADAQMLDFKPARVDLPALCRQLVDEARAEDKAGRCEVVTDWGAGVGSGTYDEKLLRHVFGNLLSNAIKYSPEGGQVRFSVRRDGGDDMVFQVSDQGIGIPADEVPHLFESFHRASNVGAIPGTGLGLAIVKNAVEMHGGTIHVDSQLGEGTTFTVRVPHRE
ncbi:MAG: PAS domain S-box protein [Burkholderiales bacterium]|nr:PAS domain S-box protein [Burkholderiales bacterium]